MPFAIDDLAAVLGHWSADEITGLSDGDPVDTLPESIASWDMLGTTTTRPLYKPSGLSSLPSVLFDGTDDRLVVGSSKSLGAVGASFCAVIAETANKTHSMFSLDTISGLPTIGNAGQGLYCHTYPGIAVDLYRREAANSQNLRYYTGSTGYTTSPIILTGIFTRQGIAVRVSGRARCPQIGLIAPSENLKAASYYASWGNSTVASSAFQGHLAELVLFGETQLCESLYIEGVLGHKYSIALDSSHPFYSAAPTSAPGSGGGGTPTTFHPLQSRALGPR